MQKVLSKPILQIAVILSLLLFFAQDIYSSDISKHSLNKNNRTKYSPDSDTLYFGDNFIVRNHNSRYEPDFRTSDEVIPALIAEWGQEIIVTDDSIDEYYDPIIVASDSLLHIFADNFISPYSAHHYLSYDNGNTWNLYGDYIDTSSNVIPGVIKAYCEDNILYTTWSGRHGNENCYIYFRASTDYGQTWPVSAEILQNPYHWRDAKRGNVSGHGDTVFVSFVEDALCCWRSFDGGEHWENFGYFATVSGIGYEPSLTYKAGVISIAYNTLVYYPQHSVLDVFYVNSFDLGETWCPPVFLGYFDNAAGQWPEVAADSLGNIAVCWMDYLGTPYSWTGGIWCKVSHDSGHTWQEAVKVNNGYLGRVGTDVVVDGDYIAVIWPESRSEDPALLYCQSWDGGLTWDQPEVVTQSYGANLVPVMVKHYDFIHLVWSKVHWEGRSIKYIRNDGVTDIPYNNGPTLPESPLLTAYPNPFNSAITLKLNNFKGGGTRIEIYDIKGDLVDILYPGVDGKAIWKSHNNYNKNLASGVYFAKTTSISRPVQTIKLIYLK